MAHFTKKIIVIANTPQYQLGFGSSVHKTQGSTQERIIVSFLDRPGQPNRKEFHSNLIQISLSMANFTQI